MNSKAKYYLDKYQMIQHPEGGYYKEVYRSGEILNADMLSGRYNGKRNISTMIYFLLEGEQISLFHKLNSDEIWNHIDGGAVKIYLLDQSGKLSEIVIGKKTDSGTMLHSVIREGTWFAAELEDKESFVLVTCTVSPGFEFEDFILGNREELLEKYPQHSSKILKFTKA